MIPRSSDHGITFIEVLVAVLVLSIGTLAAFRVLGTAQDSVGAAQARLFAQTVALNRIEEIKAIGLAQGRELPETVDFGRQTWTLALAETGTAAGFVELSVTARDPSGTGASFVFFASPEDGSQP